MIELSAHDEETIADPMVSRFIVATNKNMYVERIDQIGALLYAMYDSGARSGGKELPSNEQKIIDRCQLLNEAIIAREVTGYSCEYLHQAGKTIEREMIIGATSHIVQLEDKFNSFDQTERRARELNILWRRDRTDWQTAADLNVVKVSVGKDDSGRPTIDRHLQNGSIDSSTIVDCSMDEVRQRVARITWRIEFMRFDAIKRMQQAQEYAERYATFGSW